MKHLRKERKAATIRCVKCCKDIRTLYQVYEHVHNCVQKCFTCASAMHHDIMCACIGTCSTYVHVHTCMHMPLHIYYSQHVRTRGHNVRAVATSFEVVRFGGARRVQE